jgi:hypothetical protein
MKQVQVIYRFGFGDSFISARTQLNGNGVKLPGQEQFTDLVGTGSGDMGRAQHRDPPVSLFYGKDRVSSHSPTLNPLI